MADLRIRESDQGEQRVLAQGWIPVNQAALCLDCEAVFRIASACPSCASRTWVLLAAFWANKRRDEDGR